jgi:glucose-1-phosphate cytidylyltransferase
VTPAAQQLAGYADLAAPRDGMLARTGACVLTENTEINLHPPVVILCGGRGLRMHGEADALPKPLVEIGGRPILWHVMSFYAAQGFRSFVLCLGHGGERIREAIETLDIVTAVEEPTGARAHGWEVVFADTGVATATGGRVARIADLVRRGTFCLTYADGLADVELQSLLAYHRSHGRAATMTVVRPLSPWGVVELDGDGLVAGFREKPPLESWVNGGFFVMEPRSLGYLGSEDVLEERPLESLARDGELVAYRHTGFWQCMDTYKDSVRLNDLWERGEAPWARPPAAESARGRRFDRSDAARAGR